MKRVLALLGAIGMVAAAVLLRGAMDGGDTGGGGGGGGGKATATLVCATELAEACAALAAASGDLEVVVAEAGDTADDLTAGAFDPATSDIAGWLTFAPYPAMVAEQRARAGAPAVLAEPTGVLARSPVVIVAWNDRAAVLDAACSFTADPWRCLGDTSGRAWADLGGSEAWGAVKPGHPLPDRTATGLLAIAEAADAWFGGSDYASNDFADPAFRTWFADLERGIPAFPTPPRTPLGEMLSKGPATFDAAATTEAAAALVGRSRDKDRLSILYPSPLVTADVVFVPVAGHKEADRMRRLLESDTAVTAFAEAGWRVDDPDLPAGDGLPRAGVLQALEALWVEVSR